MSLLAIGWEPELRGLLTVIIAVVILMGSVYAILATNIGSRLAFLVSLTALFGWLMLMGMVWWIYGIGLKGEDPNWAAVPGQTVLQDTDALVAAGVLDTRPVVPDDSTFPEEAEIVRDALVDQGFTVLEESDPTFGQAQAAASVFIEEEGAFGPGEYEVVEIFDIGGDRYPKINESLDFLAFRHEPHYVVAEVAPLVPVRTEPGRAPVPPQIDETRQVQYVYMVRDLGTVRQPSVVLTLGGGAIFLALCYLLHRRERILRQNLALPTTSSQPITEGEAAEKTPVSVG
jgi:hypothetical protein